MRFHPLPDLIKLKLIVTARQSSSVDSVDLKAYVSCVLPNVQGLSVFGLGRHILFVFYVVSSFSIRRVYEIAMPLEGRVVQRIRLD